jgi:hypothetical protein
MNGEVLQVLIRALRRLGEAGFADDASRLAARAWSALRHSDPVAAERINGTMHYLARLPDPINSPHRHGGAEDVTQEEGAHHDR